MSRAIELVTSRRARGSRALRASLLVVVAGLLVALGCTTGGGAGTPGSAGKSGAGSPAQPDPPVKPRLPLTRANAAPNERPEDAVESSARLAVRSQAALNDLQRIAREARVPPELETLARELPQRHMELKARLDAAREDMRRSRRSAWVRDVRFAFVEDDRQISAWQAQVDEASAVVSSGRRRTAELLDFWRRADELAKKAQIAPEIARQTTRVVEEAQRTELLFTRPEAVLIPLQLSLAEMHDISDSFARYSERVRPQLFANAHEYDFSAWEAARRLAALGDPLGAVQRASSHSLQMVRLFVAASGEAILLHAAFMLVLWLGIWGLRSRGAPVGDERESSLARRVIARPAAAALLFGMIASSAFYDSAPTIMLVIACAVAVTSALVLFPHFLDARAFRSGYVLGVFLLVDAARLFLLELVALERLVLTLELVAVSVVLAWMIRKKHWENSLLAQHAPRIGRAVSRLWLAVVALAALAALIGYGRLAEVLGGGTLISLYLALIAAAGFEAGGGTVWLLTQDELFGRLNSVSKHRAKVVAASCRLLFWVAIVLWAQWSLRFLTLGRPARRLLWTVFGASLEIGSLKISVGDVVVLLVGAWLALKLAQLIRFLLEEDVMSRFGVSQGTQQVASFSAYYAVLLLGFFLTLAAAGIELGKLTVLAGALGVGIGFGLQNVVQNFVAGLLLMFGGTIKVGDKIQIGDLMGEVRAIGFRASTVRTWQGAEVIVPNSKLIADQVINWTLTDQKRRIEIEVGVAYGTDPERVLALLLEIARAHSRVLAEPAPQSIFLRTGESSLTFQLLAWVTFDDFTPVRSQLTTEIYQRLRAEQIPMPFPQRDLNLTSIGPELTELIKKLLPRSS